MPAFSVEDADLRKTGPVIEVTFGLSNGAIATFQEQRLPIPPPIRTRALIDTGASHSLVEEGLLDSLALYPVGAVAINTPSSAYVPCAEYAVRLSLSHGVWLDTTVIQAPADGLAGQTVKALIGRDILRFGILIYLGHMGQFTLSF